MIRFMPIFSDNALFQQLSVLTIRGFANPLAALKASILTEYGVCVSSSTATADSDGAFSVALQTPKGSFDRFVIRVADGTETKEIVIDKDYVSRKLGVEKKTKDLKKYIL